jgi:hypothetical protein
MQSVISIRTSVILTPTRLISIRRVRFPHAQDWFLNAEYDFHPQSVLSTHTRVSLTCMRVNMTLTSVIYMLECDSYTQTVISTHTRV